MYLLLKLLELNWKQVPILEVTEPAVYFPAYTSALFRLGEYQDIHYTNDTIPLFKPLTNKIPKGYVLQHLPHTLRLINYPYYSVSQGRLVYLWEASIDVSEVYKSPTIGADVLVQNSFLDWCEILVHSDRNTGVSKLYACNTKQLKNFKRFAKKPYQIFEVNDGVQLSIASGFLLHDFPELINFQKEMNSGAIWKGVGLQAQEMFFPGYTREIFKIMYGFC